MSLANIISVIGESYIDWKNVYYIISSVLSAINKIIQKNY